MKEQSKRVRGADFLVDITKQKLDYHPYLTPGQSGRILGHLRQGTTASADLLRDESFMSGVQGEKWEYAFARYENLTDLYASCHYRFVVGVARQNHRSLPIEEAVVSGIIGVHKAIEQFDIARENHFLAYAKWKMLQEIQRAEREQLKITEKQQRSLMARDMLIQAFVQVEGRDPSPQELSNQMLVNSKIYLPQITFALSYKGDKTFLLDGLNSKALDNTGKFVKEDTEVVMQARDHIELPSLIQTAMKEHLTPNEYRLISRVFGLRGERVPVSTIAVERDEDIETVTDHIERALRKMQQDSGIQSISEIPEKVVTKKPELEHILFTAKDSERTIPFDLQQKLDEEILKKDKIYLLLQEGYTKKEIAEHFNITVSTVDTVLGTLRNEGRIPRQVTRQELKKEAEKDPLTEKVRDFLSRGILDGGIYRVTAKRKL